jgi:hypothetical protein
MTDIVPAWVVTASGAPANHGGRNYIPQMIPSGLRTSLEMWHLFGDEFATAYPERLGITEKTTGDHSRNGRHLTKVGSTPVGAKSFTSSTSDYFLSPLTGADLSALSADGSFAACAVGKFPNTLAVAIGTWNFPDIDGWAFGRSISSGSRYQSLTTYASLTDLATPLIVTDGDSGTVYEFLAVSYDMDALTVTLYRMKPGGAMQSSSVALSGVLNPAATRICFGRSYPAVNFVGGCELVLGGCFSSAVSAGGMDDLQGNLETFLTANGVAI